MTQLLHDLRFAVRSLARRPGFALMVILILGLGMGATTAVVDLAYLLATALASVLVARRASLLEPLHALRHE